MQENDMMPKKMAIQPKNCCSKRQDVSILEPTKWDIPVEIPRMRTSNDIYYIGLGDEWQYKQENEKSNYR